MLELEPKLKQQQKTFQGSTYFFPLTSNQFGHIKLALTAWQGNKLEHFRTFQVLPDCWWIIFALPYPHRRPPSERWRWWMRKVKVCLREMNEKKKVATILQRGGTMPSGKVQSGVLFFCIVTVPCRFGYPK